MRVSTALDLVRARRVPTTSPAALPLFIPSTLAAGAGTDMGPDRHQVYHATTTVGFASQYMNEHSANSVLEHIREWSTHDPINGGQREGVSAACLGADWAELRPKPKVQRLVRCA